MRRKVIAGVVLLGIAAGADIIWWRACRNPDAKNSSSAAPPEPLAAPKK